MSEEIAVTTDLREFTHENTRRYTGDTFQVSLEDGSTVDLILHEVKMVREKHATRELLRDTFAWHLHGPAAALLPQRTYRVTHQTLGSFDLFIVPLGVGHEQARYEAVFN
jgi:hypothetical protein